MSIVLWKVGDASDVLGKCRPPPPTGSSVSSSDNKVESSYSLSDFKGSFSGSTSFPHSLRIPISPISSSKFGFSIDSSLGETWQAVRSMVLRSV
ncbi:hypothetical protein XELAEV_18034527mg [Xenopus laevis]|uniref:Uncharacterized protein n=1 Tax=Xenopus laevis TaxID=8355 RepID=A0A974HBM3_XENLA|nr:hypothetical protein XELAEV_18034527mg [Xenopus laevis]